MNACRNFGEAESFYDEHIRLEQDVVRGLSRLFVGGDGEVVDADESDAIVDEALGGIFGERDVLGVEG